MSAFIQKFRAVFLTAAGFSLVANLMLIVPSIYFLQVFDRVLTSRSHETLWMLTLLGLLALAIAGVLDSLRGKLLSTAGVALEKQLGPKVLGAMLEDAARPSPSPLLHQGLRDVGVLRGFLGGAGLASLFDLPWLPAYLLIIFLFHPVLGAVALLGAVGLLVLALLNERRSRQPLERLGAESRRVARMAELSLRNAEVVAAMGMTPALAQHWSRQSTGVLKLQLASSRISNGYSVLSKSARQIIQMLMLAVGAWLVIGLDASPGIMIAATILLGRALAPMESVIGAWRQLVEAGEAFGRLRTVLANAEAVAPRTQLPAPQGELRVEQAVFGIKPQEPAIIKGVSFQLPAGASLAVIGPSASGKSTLARLLVGSWKPAAGTVRLDGADISAWAREDLGAHIGYLPQDVELFAGTISENIARMGAIDDGAVIEAAQRAGVHDMILRLPQGYDTPIGEGGTFLSGGQRQRIGLARALYGDPRLLVLDEPNANLDSDGEAALLQVMRDCRQRRVTLILITHRPAMLGEIDAVLVLREGRVSRFGPRDEVLAEVAPAMVQMKPPSAVEPLKALRA